MAEWDTSGDKNRGSFPYSHHFEEGVTPRQIVEMARWLGSEEGLKGNFFFERERIGDRFFSPSTFHFSDETTGMHFKLKFG